MAPPFPGPGAVGAAVALATCGVVAGWQHRPTRWSGIVLLAALLGGLRAQSDRAAIEASTLPADVRAVRGTVAEVPRPVGRASVFVLDVDSISTDGKWENRPSRVEARTFGWVPAEGDRVELTGEPRAPLDMPGAPRATQLRRQRVTQEIQVERMQLLSSPLSSAGRLGPRDLRVWMEQRINAFLDVPQSALISGLLLGSRSDLSPEVRAQFAQTGTSHIVAVSGFNVVLVAGFVTSLSLGLMGVRMSALQAILAVLAYTLVVGAPPSAVRAAVMAGGALAARAVGRPADSLNALLLAGALIVLVDPLVVQDLGFQLSMLATGGLILLIPPVTTGRTWRERVGNHVMPPLAAQVATLPLVLHTFHSLSLVALLANVIVAPLIPIAMAAGGLLILLSGIDAFAVPVAWVAWLSATGILETVRVCAELPGAWLATGDFPVTAMLFAYAALAVWIIQRSPELQGLERVRPWLRVSAALLVGATMLSLMDPLRSSNELSGELLEFGDLMIVTSPSGKTLVVGTNVSPQILTTAIAERLPFWKRSIDVVVLSDDTPAAWRGARAIAGRYPVEILLTPPSEGTPEIPDGVARLVEASENLRLDLGDDTELRILPESTSSVARTRELPFALTYGGTGVKFPTAAAGSGADSVSDGWITVTRNSASESELTTSTGALVRWGRPTRRGTNSAALELIPRTIGPVLFTSDGQRLTLRWNGCQGADSACSTVTGARAVDTDRQPL